MRHAIAQSFDVPVDHGRVKLAVAIVEPGDYKLEHQLTLESKENNRLKMTVKMRWEKPDPIVTAPPLKGTVVLLHGVYMAKEAMVHWALYLAASGYRCVLVDHRGHGASTGDWITYGRDETSDLIRVLDELQARKIASDQIGVLGISYGAVLGIHWANRDPRVKALVALQPYSDIRAAIFGVLRGNFGEQVKPFSDETIYKAIARAPAKARFSWKEVEVLPVVKSLTIPVLIFHGRLDHWVPPAHSEAIKAIAPEGSRLRVLENDVHSSLSVRLDPIAPDVVAWFDQRLPRK
jgi:pimeloyl-ACP methyl ester carboxylesterase